MKLPRLPTPPIQAPYVCNNCIRRKFAATPLLPNQPRSYSTLPPPPQPPTQGFSLLPTRRLLSLRGPDTTKFLQGLITANITPTSHTSGFYTSFLNGQGRLVNDVFIYPQVEAEDGWYIEVDSKEAEVFAKHLKKYKLRAKFEVRLLEVGEMGVWSLWDEGSGWTGHTFVSVEKAGGRERQAGCEDNRAPGMGRRLLLPGGRKPDAEMEESNEEAYRIRRYLKGVPEGQDELFREQSLPQESNVDFMGGIDYRKGCYVGQELTIRTHHTGVVRKRVLPVMIYGAEEPEPSTLEYIPENGMDARLIPSETNFGRSGKKGRSAGKWLRGVGNVGLGLCRIEIMTDVAVQGGSGGYNEGDEFKLEWEVEGEEGLKMVKAKAFVPAWHLTRQKGLKVRQ